MHLAFLNIGPGELGLILVLFLLLFGADRIPQLARALGKAKAELERAQRNVQHAIKNEEEKAFDEQLAFERAREHQMRQADAELQSLERAARELGLETEGRSHEELRAMIAARVGEDAGGKKDP